MTATAKKVTAIVLIGLIAIIAFGFVKAKKLKEIFDKMTITPASFPKGLDINFNENRIKFKIDIRLTNPTKEDFNANGFIAKLSKVKVFYDNKYLGVSTVNISDISIPHQNEIILHDIDVVVDFSNAVDILLSLSNFSTDKLSFSGVIEVAGVEYEIVN